MKRSLPRREPHPPRSVLARALLSTSPSADRVRGGVGGCARALRRGRRSEPGAPSEPRNQLPELVLPERADVPPPGYRQTAIAVTRVGGPAARGAHGTRRASTRLLAGVHERRGPLAGLVLRAAAARQRADAQRGDRAGGRRRPQRARARDVDRAAGGLDDGTRDPRPVRPCRQRPVGVDRALRAVRGAVRCAGRSGCCTSISPCCWRSPSRTRSSGRPTSTCPCRRPIRCSRTCSARMLWPAFRRPRTSRTPSGSRCPAGFLLLGLVFLVGFRVVLNVTNGNVIDVGYAGRHRRRPAAARGRALRRVPARQRARRHLRADRLRRLRAVRAALRLGRHLGRPAGGARRRRRVRSRLPRRDVARRPRGRRSTLGPAARLPVGCLPVHAAGRQLRRQRRARRRARPGGVLMSRPPGRPWRAGHARGPDQVRAARARAAVRHLPRRSRAQPRRRGGRRRRSSWRPSRSVAGRAGAVLGSHPRVPGGARLAVLRSGASTTAWTRSRPRSPSPPPRWRSRSRSCPAGATSSPSRRSARRC